MKIRRALTIALPRLRPTFRPLRGGILVILAPGTELTIASDRLSPVRVQDTGLLARASRAIYEALQWPLPRRPKMTEQSQASKAPKDAPQRVVFVHGGDRNFRLHLKSASGLHGARTVWRDLNELNDPSVRYDVLFPARAGQPLEVFLITRGDPKKIPHDLLGRWHELATTAKNRSAFRILKADENGRLRDAQAPPKPGNGRLPVRPGRSRADPEDPAPDF